MANPRHYKGMPGWVTERRSPDKSGHIVLFDGDENALSDGGRNKWVVRYFPEGPEGPKWPLHESVKPGSFHIFPSMTAGRQAIAKISAGVDEFNILPSDDPKVITGELEVVNSPSKTERMDARGYQDVVEEKIKYGELMDTIMEASKATMWKKVDGKWIELPDWAIRLSACRQGSDQLVGKPLVKQEVLHKEVGPDEVPMEGLMYKPGFREMIKKANKKVEEFEAKEAE